MISFIYFDLGGVVIKDFSATHKWQALQTDLGIADTNQAAFDKLWLKYRDEICVTRDIDSLIPIINQELALKIPSNYSLLEDFVSRFEPNPSLWPIILSLKTKCSVGLLTNMYPRMFSAIQKRDIMPPVEWDVIIDSSVEGTQKPEERIFRLAYERSGVPNKGELLFIDNTQEHLDAAKALGWQTFFYDSHDYQKSSHQLAGYLASSLPE